MSAVEVLREFKEKTNSHIFDFHTVSVIQKSKELENALEEACLALEEKERGL